jgi:hypothetical protein
MTDRRANTQLTSVIRGRIFETEGTDCEQGRDKSEELSLLACPDSFTSQFVWARQGESVNTQVASLGLTLFQTGLARWTRALIALGAICFSSVALSAGSVTNATITQIQISTTYSEVFIAVNVAKTSNPSCSANGTFGFVLPLTTSLENQMLAVLLSIRATGSHVSLTGSGLCDTYPSVETLVQINY